MDPLAPEARGPTTASLNDVYNAFYAEQQAKANSRMARLYGTSSIIRNAATSAARYNAIPEVTSILAATEQVSPAGTSTCKTCHPILEGSLAILRFFWSWIIAPALYLVLCIILVVGTPWLLYQAYNVAAFDIPRRIRELPRHNLIHLLRVSIENLFTRVRRTYYYYRFHPIKDEFLNRYRTITRWMEQRRLYILFLVPALFALKAIWLSYLTAEGPLTAWTELDVSDVPWYMQIDRKEVGSNHFGDPCKHISFQERDMDDLVDSMDFDVPDDDMDMGVNVPDESMDMDMFSADDVLAKGSHIATQLNETELYGHAALTYTLLVTLTETHEPTATVTETEYATITVSGSMTTSTLFERSYATSHTAIEVEQETITRMQLATLTQTNDLTSTVTEDNYATSTLPRALHTTTETYGHNTPSKTTDHADSTLPHELHTLTERGERTTTLIETMYRTVSLPQALYTMTESKEHTTTLTERQYVPCPLSTTRTNEHTPTLTETATLIDSAHTDERMTTLTETMYVTVTASRPIHTSTITGRYTEAFQYPTPEVEGVRHEVGTGNTFCKKCGQSHCCELLYPATQSHEKDAS